MSTPLAVSLGANLILGAYIFVAAVGLVFGYFTVRGSGINNHPWHGHGTPGAKLPDQFHQFADWQAHEADLRNAEIERRVEARLAQPPVEHPAWHLPLPRPRPVEQRSDDMSLDEANRALAEEAAVRKSAQAEQDEHADVR